MIVIPMAGISQRFTAAGYSVPKYMLPLHGRPVFDYATSSFRRYYEDELFVFVCRDVLDTAQFVRDRAEALGIGRSIVVTLDGVTSGQADTVVRGLEAVDVEPGALTIFNIDSFRANYIHAPMEAAGLLEVFRGHGDGWSFVQLAENGAVVRVEEKNRISDLCCTGLYRFVDCEQFLQAYFAERKSPSQIIGESYIAPCYNQIIQSGMPVVADIIDKRDVVFCGVPEEYVALRSSTEWLDRLGGC